MEKNIELPEELKLDFPFVSKFYHLKKGQGKIHYVDEGSELRIDLDKDRHAILCVHGNPSWSYLFRNVISSLRDSKRIIALDHLGMGLSSNALEHTSLENHQQNLLELLNHLGVTSVDLVVHDWGGPIGVGALLGTHIKICSLVFLNTSIGPVEEIPWRIRLLAFSFWRELLVKNFALFNWGASWMSTFKKLKKSIKSAYLFPYANSSARAGVSSFLAEIPWSSDHTNYLYLEKLRTRCRQELQKVPKIILWGGGDFCFSEHYFKQFKADYPQDECCYYPEYGHWSLEDDQAGSGVMLQKIISFLKR